ncbi:DNA-3-methyladenine glycosylase family protein [Providencia sneebia]|uniref:DNA-3-methyladenine glycosylase II n=1 Tax=Providencia sneebia DSM 19967 TaxID=1141660 RepID=K8WK04_9GAMM|nr:hypothetical protein OO7_02526 [Providencia sneebia DSM 19967]
MIFFAYHLRDSHSIAEIVEGQSLRKGLLWDGKPAEICIDIKNNNADISLNVDGQDKDLQTQRIIELGNHMLGLQQNVEQFEEQYAAHPLIGPLIKRQQGLRIYQSSSSFEALIWAIIGQQISVTAAVAIRRRFIQAVGTQHSSGIWCFPSEQQVAAVDDEALRLAGLSTSKIAAIRTLCEAIASQHVDLSSSVDNDNVQEFSQQLMSLKGIGPWTVSYALLRGFNYLDGSLHGDVAVRRNLQTLLALEKQPTAKETEKWLDDFSPWRALVGAHLWRSQSSAGY